MQPITDTRQENGETYLRAHGVAFLLLCQFASTALSEVPLHSVGQLLIPTIHFEDGRRRHFDERCSGTLVAPDGDGHSRWVLTAWHCLEYYRDLSRPITFRHSSGKRSTAQSIASGGAMHADWALMRLRTRMPGAVLLEGGEIDVGAALVMAGYSRQDQDGADGGEEITSDENCRVTGELEYDIASNCHARRGASGGAVFSGDGRGSYLGIISRGDSEDVSIFVPLRRLLKGLAPYLSVPSANAADLPPR